MSPQQVGPQLLGPAVHQVLGPVSSLDHHHVGGSLGALLRLDQRWFGALPIRAAAAVCAALPCFS